MLPDERLCRDLAVKLGDSIEVLSRDFDRLQWLAIGDDTANCFHDTFGKSQSVVEDLDLVGQ